MNININLINSRLQSQDHLQNSNDQRIKSADSSDIKPETKIRSTYISFEKKQEKDKNYFDDALIEKSKYKDTFKREGIDFSNMSTNELYTLVKEIIEIDMEYTKKYGSDEPVRYGKSGKPIISQKLDDMTNLAGTLEILSYGKGDVDPNEKINVMEYFSNRSEMADNFVKENPQRQTANVRSHYVKQLVNTLDNFVSDENFNSYKDKAILLLADKHKVDIEV